MIIDKLTEFAQTCPQEKSLSELIRLYALSKMDSGATAAFQQAVPELMGKDELENPDNIGKTTVCTAKNSFNPEEDPALISYSMDERNAVSGALNSSSRKNVYAAIYADAKETIDAVEKQDYISHQKAATSAYKAMIDNSAGTTDPDELALIKHWEELSRYNFDNCYLFLSSLIMAQTQALIGVYGYTPFELMDFDKLIKDKAAKLYPPKERANIKRISPQELANSRDFFAIPSSQPFNLMRTALIYGDPAAMNGLTAAYNRHAPIQVVESSKGKFRVVQTSDSGQTTTIQIDTLAGISCRNSMQAQKIYTLILEKIGTQALNNGALIRDRILFNLSELVSESIYKDTRTARKGFVSVMKTLTGMRVDKITTKGKRTDTIQDGLLFVGYGFSRGDDLCYVDINYKLNWAVIVDDYYAIMPKWYYELPDKNSTALCSMIFTTARRNPGNISKDGTFTMTLESIRAQLALPNPKDTKSPGERIKEPIEHAIQDILETADDYRSNHPSENQSPVNPELNLAVVATDTLPVKDWLLTGNVQVTLSGEYAERIKKIQDRKIKKIEAATKRKQKIEDTAKAKAMAASEVKGS